MQTVKASELFDNDRDFYNSDIDNLKNITLDFSNIDTIDIKGITTLLNIQKLALINNKSISTKNVKPSVNRVLDITGLNKTFANLATNPISRK